MSDEENIPPGVEPGPPPSQEQDPSSSLDIPDPPTPEEPNQVELTIGSSPDTAPALIGDAGDTGVADASTTNADLDADADGNDGSSNISLVLHLTQLESRMLSQMCSDCCSHICLVVTYPAIVVMMVMSIISLIVVLGFCVLPSICVYYCVKSEPLPLNELLRNLFFDNAQDHRPAEHFHRPGFRRESYRSMLIVRRLLSVEAIKPSASQASSGDDIESTVVTIDNRTSMSTLESGCNLKKKQNDKVLVDKIHIRKHEFPIRIRTDHKSLYFSAPLTAPISECGSDNGNEKSGLEKETREVPSDDADGVDGNVNGIVYGNVNGSSSSNNDNAGTPENFFETEHSSNIRETTATSISTDFRSEQGQNSSDSTNTTARSIPLGDVTDLQADSCSSSNNVFAHNDSNLTHGSIAEETGNEGANGDDSDIDIDGGDNSSDVDATKNHRISSPNADYFGTEDDEGDPGTSCDICILDFEVGDEVAWSPNLDCSHAFHKDCILNWIVRKPTCPNCRQDYIDDGVM